ncbi:MAG TPA: sigma-70 family RNA polymerase sigma factor [Bryobacteraceae bacterium]|nr:sigma-70 family RNA polymerase sigma factor [Bryobacteraceae bacterium]
METRAEATTLLTSATLGDAKAADQLVPLVYGELRRLAAHYLRGERPDHTLQPTALVNEAYLQLIDQKSNRWQNRAHFIGVAAQLMRRILVDHARAHRADKRGGRDVKVPLDAALVVSQQRSEELLVLDEALQRLAVQDLQQSRIVELRFFGGLSVEETAEVLGISTATVKRDWSVARAWLYRELAKL